MIRLIALDIDGTLLDSRWQVPPVNRDAIRRATDAGIEVALVTGRRFDFARPVIEQLDGPLTLIVSGGALVKRRDGETLVRHLLPAAIARAVVDATADFRDATALVFDRPQAGQVVHERLDIRDAHRRSYFQRNRDFITEVVPLEAALVEDPIQVMFSGGVARMRELVALVRSLDVAPQIAVAVTEYESRDFSLVDVNRGGCTKGTTLAEWVGAPGADARRRDGGRRQLQRPRDAGVRGHPRGDGQRRRGTEGAGLAGHPRQRPRRGGGRHRPVRVRRRLSPIPGRVNLQS